MTLTKQQASAQIAELLKQAKEKHAEAVQLADANGLAFDVGIGGVTNTYISQGYLDEKSRRDDAGEDLDDYDAYYSEYGSDGWQSSSC